MTSKQNEVLETLKKLPNWTSAEDGSVINLLNGNTVYLTSIEHFLAGFIKGKKILCLQLGAYTGYRNAPLRLDLENPENPERLAKFLRTTLAESQLLFPNENLVETAA